VDIFRYIGAIMVIAIHTHPFAEIDTGTTEMIRTISRLAVPFFFAASGYYFVKRFRENASFLDYVMRIAKDYCIWSGIYFILDFIKWGHTNLKGFIVNCFSSFFVLGSHYHLWYIIALISSVCITALFLRLRRENLLLWISGALFAVGAFDSGYLDTITGSNILSGLPFFTAGLLVSKLETKYQPKNGFKPLPITLLSIVIWVVLSRFDIVPEGVITLGLYPLTCMLLFALLQNPMPQWHAISRKCRSISDFTYYFHPICIEVVIPIAEHAFHVTITQTGMFVLTVCMSWVLASCVAQAQCRRKRIQTS
jgi:surface polysaccharide O-acyltransferase-like enzyme